MNKTSGCLGYIRDYITQLCSDYHKPLRGSLLKNSRMESKVFFFLGSYDNLTRWRWDEGRCSRCS